MTPEQKNNVLANLNRVPIEDLKSYLSDEKISFQEMRESGLNHEKQSALREFIAEIEAEKARKRAAEDDLKRKEQLIWDNAQRDHKARSYEEYLSMYPNGQYVEIARMRIVDLEKTRGEEKERILNDIKINPDKYSPLYIEDLITDKIFRRRDLIDQDIITEKALDLYFNPPHFVLGDDQNSWSDMPPLPSGKTDIYYFGIPGSGKSCILAGMMYKAKHAGILKLDVRNKKGVDYMNNLTRAVKAGYVPPSTNQESVNYISCSLIDNEREHPVSIIEMSGEFFNRTYTEDSVDSKGSIGASGYLKNDNDKVIYFVLDYKKHIEGDDFNEIAGQDQIFEYVLEKLDMDGTLAKTKSIQIIVSKSDLMPEGEIIEYTGQFLKTHYKGLVENVKRACKKYGINKSRNNNVVYHPFSLGKFMLGKTYEYRGTDSQYLLKTLLNSLPHKRGNSFLNIFNK